MKDQKEVKAKGNLLLIVLLLIVIIVAIVVSTGAWSKYTEEKTSSSTGNVAKWNIGAESGQLSVKTYQEVVEGKMAPGTEGEIPITVENNDTEVDVKYTIYIDSVDNKPKNLFFYQTSETEGIGKGTREISSSLKAIEYTVKQGESPTNPVLKWKWPYTTEGGTADKDDTDDGKETDENRKMTVNFRIVAEQVQPTASNP